MNTTNEQRLAAALRALLAHVQNADVHATPAGGKGRIRYGRTEYARVTAAREALAAYDAAPKLPADMWIMQAPVISTAHVDKAASETLAEMADGSVSAIVYDISGGWLIYCGEEYDPPAATPDSVKACIRWAMSHGFQWVRLDMDADAIDALPTYEW